MYLITFRGLQAIIHLNRNLVSIIWCRLLILNQFDRVLDFIIIICCQTPCSVLLVIMLMQSIFVAVRISYVMYVRTCRTCRRKLSSLCWCAQMVSQVSGFLYGFRPTYQAIIITVLTAIDSYMIYLGSCHRTTDTWVRGKIRQPWEGSCRSWVNKEILHVSKCFRTNYDCVEHHLPCACNAAITWDCEQFKKGLKLLTSA